MKFPFSFNFWRVPAAAILAATALAGASPAVAQDVIGAGNVISGNFPQGGGGCWLLPTKAGERWRIQLDGDTTYAEVGRGTCEQFIRDKSDFNGSILEPLTRIDFVSGGGVYVVRGQSFVRAAIAYTLRVDLIASASSAPAGPSGVSIWDGNRYGPLPPGGPVHPWLTVGWTPPSVSSTPVNAGKGLPSGTVFKDCADVCPEMVVVPRGSFTMGSPADEAGRGTDEGPRHPVAFVNAFAIGRYEVTFAEYDACVAEGGCTFKPNDQGWGRGQRPVFNVSWNDAQAYAAWLSTKTGQRYTLPSESEWEYAARAGSNNPWQTGNAILTDDANILNAFGRTVNVGGYPPNRFGLHDVHGNVAEWTLDCADTGYIGVPNDGSAATSGRCAQARLLRGGQFTSEPASVRFAARTGIPQSTRAVGIGFRIARAL